MQHPTYLCENALHIILLCFNFRIGLVVSIASCVVHEQKISMTSQMYGGILA